MDPHLLDHYRWMARYNAWFNQRLFDASEQLDDAARKLDRGAFFGSIHRTLNHLIVADQIWLKRLHQCGVENGFDCQALSSDVLNLPAGHALNQPVFDDWKDLRAKRSQIDAAISLWLAEMPDAFPGFTMRYSNTSGVQRQHPAWQAMSHFFNHQTHHRGQATTLLKQAGVDPGVTDLLALVNTG
ncbi:MAG: DinB family protein [Betaproteobacteria bacterium]